jgi:transcription-repair coupling factor (superfamily II helicase)
MFALMSLPGILDGILGTPAGRALIQRPPEPGSDVRVTGVFGSAGAALVATLHRELSHHRFIFVVDTPESAARVEADLEALLGPEQAFLFPQGEARFYSSETDPRIGGLRVEAVEALFSGRGRLFITTPRGLQDRIAIPDRLAQLRLSLQVGEEVGFELLVEALESMGYARVPLVESVGQFAVRGGLIDVFSLGSPDPLRIEFWGDEISSLRRFQVSDQRSLAALETVHLLPASFRSTGDDTGTGQPRALLEILPDDAILVDSTSESWPGLFQKYWDLAEEIRRTRMAGGETLAEPDRLLVPVEDAVRAVQRRPRVTLRPDGAGDLNLGADPPPQIERRMDRLESFLREEALRGYETLILCDNEGQVERLEEILSPQGRRIPGGTLAIGSLETGFRLPRAEPPLNVLTDHEIFRRTRRIRANRSFRGAVALEGLSQLNPGDYVVHMDHGIGQFRGLEHLQIAGEDLEVLSIEYAGGEILRVPVYRLDLVERWVGETDEDEPPQVHRIGGKPWKTLRRRTEEAIAKLMRELVELYAAREIAQGFAFSADTRWQMEMEASFPYEDTPDQAKVSAEVKRDMEKPRPMDRLVCGDVGFGKTEVAIRAAFKAVQDGKQVAVLAPTTILVEQHQRSFEERLAAFPVKIGALSRFRSQGEVTEIVAGLSSGEVDIVIGTHRLLSDDIRFQNLGLLIIDEEQRFGVKHKERLKKLKTSVDVLTLTATPIPRTLQFSLAGLRNLSIIRTPPRDRLAVHTQTIQWSDALLSEILARELDRGGQVYFLHNRVETIYSIAERVQRLAPQARVDVAHGQMGAKALGESMGGFIAGETDILVCSSIVENGLDVPNANTLIVDRADRFGLAQLYQIRGRVGRSNRRAWCYLIAPHGLSEEARQRLSVLEHHTALGSGYQVALRDMELRGAGSLLGSDQSGFAHAVGMDTYLRMLEAAVRQIRAGEHAQAAWPEPEVALAGAALIPDSYLSDSGQKLHLYRRLSRIETLEALENLREEMRDRYGPPPEEVVRLLDSHALRLLGKALGIEVVRVRGREGRITFRAAAAPRLTDLEPPFRAQQIEVEIKRLSPLSLGVRQGGTVPLTQSLIRALEQGAPSKEPERP